MFYVSRHVDYWEDERSTERALVVNSVVRKRLTTLSFVEITLVIERKAWLQTE